MSASLDRSVRTYVAQATGLQGNHVLQGNAQVQRPNDLYASLLPMFDQRTSMPAFTQLRTPEGIPSGTFTATPRRRTYSLQFYRPGSFDAANRFVDYAASENGLLAAQHTFGSYNGSVRHVRVYGGGMYSSPPRVGISAASGDGARLEAQLADGEGPRPIRRIDVLEAGSGYAGRVSVDIEGDATAVAFGHGFVIEQPIEVRRLDVELGDGFEERSRIELVVRYTSGGRQDTGGIGSNEYEIVDGRTGNRCRFSS